MLSVKKVNKRSPERGGKTGHCDSAMKGYHSSQVNRRQSQAPRNPQDSKLSNYSTTANKMHPITQPAPSSYASPPPMTKAKSLSRGLLHRSATHATSYTNATPPAAIASAHQTSKKSPTTQTLAKSTNPHSTSAINLNFRTSFSLKNSTSMAFLKGKIGKQ